MPRLFRLLLCGCGTMLITACQPKTSSELVDARNIGSFDSWRSDASSQHSQAEWKEFDDAIQELRFQAMRDGVTGSDSIGAAMCEKVNGHTFRDVVLQGYQSKLAQLIRSRNEVKRAIDKNDLVVLSLDDDTAQKTLRHTRADEQQRLDAILHDIEATHSRITALGGTVPLDSWNPAPAVHERHDAILFIWMLMNNRRQNAKAQYGHYEAEIAEDSDSLPDDQKSAFAAKLTSAKKLNHDVIAVKIRTNWWIYDRPTESPVFSPALTANLTSEDWDRINRQWAVLTAEIWARRQAHDHPEGPVSPE